MTTKIFCYLLPLAIITLFASHYKRKILPDSSKMLPVLQNEPIQTKTQSKNFIFKYLKTEYFVQPVADYEIWGLVATHNNIHSIADIYHDKTSVDIKDLCVLWGSNVDSNNYHNIKFSSNAFICSYQTMSREASSKFDKYKFSNSHLLSNNKTVRNKIRNVRIGDQIYMKGMLVNYAPKTNLRHLRKSSLTRKDTGDGACEVIFVNEIKVLKRGNIFWHTIYENSKRLIIISLILIPLLFVISTYIENKKRYQDLS